MPAVAQTIFLRRRHQPRKPAPSLCFILSVPLLLWTCFQLAATLTASLLRALSCRCWRVNSLFEDPGSALKGGVKVCKRRSP